jgi:hypothetical protein
MKLEYSGHILQRYSDIKFNQNPASGSRVVLCGQTDGLTYMTKLIVASRSFPNAPKNWRYPCNWPRIKTLLGSVVLYQLHLKLVLRRVTLDSSFPHAKSTAELKSKRYFVTFDVGFSYAAVT